MAVAVFAALLRINAGLSDVATTTTECFIPSSPRSRSTNSRTSLPRSPIRAMTLISALVFLANELLKDTDMTLENRITVVSAIGNHDESTGSPVDVISAALIIADKTDVRRSRVRQKERSAFDIHDRVNYAVTDSKLKIAEDKSVIALNLQIDENICSMYGYFEIFLERMMFCRKSAEILGTTFKLTANGRKVL